MIPLGPVTSTNGTTYTAAQVLTMLEGPSLRMRWLFDLLSDQLIPKSGVDLTSLIDRNKPPVISYDSSRAVKRELRFTMRSSSMVNTLQDLVRIRYQILAPDGGWLEWIIGIFMFTPPQKEIHEGVTLWSVTAPDLSQLLSDAAFSNSASTPAGFAYVGAIALLVSGYGGATKLTTSIVDRGDQLPTALPYDAGESYLKRINALLAAIVYVPAYMDGTILTSLPEPDYNQVTPPLVLDTIAGQAQVIGPFKEETDYSNAFNQFLVTGQDPNREPVSAYYENTRGDSPISIENWHPRLKVINVDSLHSAQACLNRARAEAQASARIFTTLSVACPPFPFFGDRDTVTLAYQSADEGVVRKNYVVIAGTHTCDVGTATTGQLQRIVAA